MVIGFLYDFSVIVIKSFDVLGTYFAEAKTRNCFFYPLTFSLLIFHKTYTVIYNKNYEQGFN